MENKNEYSLSISFSGLLGIVFIVLKLCDVIKWSWWWVLAPIWIPFAISMVVILFVYVVGAIINRRNGV